jgi:hypothetical protein
MIEVFKTDVTTTSDARMLMKELLHLYNDYEVNFDLQDCDKVLRVKCSSGPVSTNIIIGLLAYHGFHAEILPDEIPLPLNDDKDISNDRITRHF